MMGHIPSDSVDSKVLPLGITRDTDWADARPAPTIGDIFGNGNRNIFGYGYDGNE